MQQQPPPCRSQDRRCHFSCRPSPARTRPHLAQQRRQRHHHHRRLLCQRSEGTPPRIQPASLLEVPRPDAPRELNRTGRRAARHLPVPGGDQQHLSFPHGCDLGDDAPTETLWPHTIDDPDTDDGRLDRGVQRRIGKLDRAPVEEDDRADHMCEKVGLGVVEDPEGQHLVLFGVPLALHLQLELNRDRVIDHDRARRACQQ